MKRYACALSAMFLFFAPAAGAAPDAPAPLSPLNAATAGDFALACRAGQPGQDECDDVVGTALLLGLDYAKPVSLCLPGTAYSDAVGPWLRAHPEASPMPVYDGIMLAIRTLYTCGAQDGR